MKNTLSVNKREAFYPGSKESVAFMLFPLYMSNAIKHYLLTHEYPEGAHTYFEEFFTSSSEIELERWIRKELARISGLTMDKIKWRFAHQMSLKGS